IGEFGGERTLLLGFSMGGAVSIAAADEARVEAVLGLAPWIPERLDVSTLRGKRLDVIHGALDRELPGIPGGSPSSSRRGVGRAWAAGAGGTFTTTPGAVPGAGVRGPGTRAPPPPRARRWVELVGAELARFASS